MKANSNTTGKRKPMDFDTAMAFAGEAFESRHPRETWPEWLRRCTVVGCTKDGNGRIVVSMSVTPKATKEPVSYFEAAVDQYSAETTVLRDDDFSKFKADDLHE